MLENSVELTVPKSTHVALQTSLKGIVDREKQLRFFGHIHPSTRLAGEFRALKCSKCLNLSPQQKKKLCVIKIKFAKLFLLVFSSRLLSNLDRTNRPLYRACRQRLVCVLGLRFSSTLSDSKFPQRTTSAEPISARPTAS